MHDTSKTSIHSPDKGRDLLLYRDKLPKFNFNPLSRQGERPERLNEGLGSAIFQSTLPTRGETETLKQPNSSYIISIHSPDKGRDSLEILIFHYLVISIHSPDKGRDEYGGSSGLPIRISIHSPDKGRDDRKED